MSGELLEIPWRETVDWDNCEETLALLKDECESYEPYKDFLPKDVHFPKVNILLFGEVGGGKSSVYNTINSCFRGKIFNVARSGCAEHSFTTKFTKYPIMSRSSTLSSPLKFRICDMRGLEVDHLMTKKNMRYILEGNIADRFPFDPSGYASPSMPGFKVNPDIDERIHCVAIVQDIHFVHDDNYAGSLEPIKNIREMVTIMNALDIPQVVILSKVDNICEATKEDPVNAFRSKHINICVRKISEIFGVQCNMIFPMVNYTTEDQPDPRIDVMSLKILQSMLNCCDAHLFNHYDDIIKKYST